MTGSSSNSNSKYIRDKMYHERKITEIYRRAPGGWRSTPGPVVMTGTNQIIDLRKRLPRTPSPRSPSPRVVHIQLGNGNHDYNKGGPGRGPLIEGQLTRPPIDGPPQFSNGERLAWRIAQLARMGGRIGRINPWLNAAMTAWDIWNLIRQDPKHPDPGGWNIPPGGTWICGGPGDANGVAVQGAKSPKTSPTFCALTLQAVPQDQSSAFPGYSLIFYKSYPVGASERCDMRGLYNRLDGARPPKPTRTAGTQFYVPTISQPLPYTAVDTGTGRPGPPPPPVSPIPKDPPSRPPGPRTKERKGQVSKGLGKAVQAAFAATEGKDAVDALWEALPDKIKRATPKSGRTRKGALIGEGQPYSTVLDKALHLFRNLKHLDLSEAAKNLLINQIVDKLIGTMSGKGADKLRKQLKASGWGNVI